MHIFVDNTDVLISDAVDSEDISLLSIVLLHEFGHAHMLEHAAVVFGSGQSQKLMYYIPTFDSGSIKPADLNGAVSVCGASNGILAGENDCPAAIQANGCANAIRSRGLSGFRVVPNPFISELQLIFAAHAGDNYSITVYSVAGAEIYSGTLSFNSRGEATLSLTDLRPGAYFLYLPSPVNEQTSLN